MIQIGSAAFTNTVFAPLAPDQSPSWAGRMGGTGSLNQPITAFVIMQQATLNVHALVDPTVNLQMPRLARFIRLCFERLSYWKASQLVFFRGLPLLQNAFIYTYIEREIDR